MGLLDCHPSAARLKDKDGRLPMHAAAQNSNPAAAEAAALLLEHAAGGLKMQCTDRNTKWALAKTASWESDRPEKEEETKGEGKAARTTMLQRKSVKTRQDAANTTWLLRHAASLSRGGSRPVAAVAELESVA